MKKLLLVTLAILALSQVKIQAQDDSNARTHRIRAGWQRALTKNGTDQVGGVLDAFYVGYVGDRPIASSKVFFYSGGLEYLQNGWKTDNDNFRKIHYLSAPAALKVKIGPAFIQTGPNFNIRLGESYKLLGEDALTDETKTAFFDFLWHFGVGVQISIVTLEARYSYGFTDVNHGNSNAYLQVGAGISF